MTHHGILGSGIKKWNEWIFSKEPYSLSIPFWSLLWDLFLPFMCQVESISAALHISMADHRRPVRTAGDPPRRPRRFRSISDNTTATRRYDLINLSLQLRRSVQSISVFFTGSAVLVTIAFGLIPQLLSHGELEIMLLTVFSKVIVKSNGGGRPLIAVLLDSVNLWRIDGWCKCNASNFDSIWGTSKYHVPQLYLQCSMESEFLY